MIDRSKTSPGTNPDRCSMLLALLFSLFVPARTLAQAEIFTTQDWTKDGQFAIYEHYVGSLGSFRDKDMPHEVVAISARTGERIVLDDPLGPKHPTARQDAGAAAPQRPQYREWKALHPIFEPRLDQSTGSESVDIEVNGKKLEYPFCVASARDDDPRSRGCMKGEPGTAIKCRTRVGTKLFDSHTFVIPKGAMLTEVAFLWAPGGKRILWTFGVETELIDHYWGKGPDRLAVGGGGEAVVDRVAGPRIQITRTKQVPAQVLDSVYAGIETSGTYAPTSERIEAGDRVRSVVLTRPEWRQDAEFIAAHYIPGGAEVKPLTGGGIYQVIIALGRSALRR